MRRGLAAISLRIEATESVEKIRQDLRDARMDCGSYVTLKSHQGYLEWW